MGRQDVKAIDHTGEVMLEQKIRLKLLQVQVPDLLDLLYDCARDEWKVRHQLQIAWYGSA